MRTFSILFVCMGNICRSPTAHGVFLHKVKALGLEDRIRVDSAGTHNYHPDSPPDARSQQHASRRGYDLSALRARQIIDADFEAHDLILVMDWDNLALAQDQSDPRHHTKIRRLTEFCERHDSPVVPDPYYGGERGFEHVLDLVEDACDGLLKQVRQRLDPLP
ncbi:phosphotyrosine protein phosphatase [Rhodoferax koreense]|uniref:Phosphotyrosine protein phosphatase n=1 Tax=Rhodoferax koreensis TaxID=1842727 RepID=A0A1P8JPZ8_9BURK|nr:low molecular weight protein-tyrosine-phosphatase [Rhodoferax koreense]APW35812.1 phosphotyrosine protein phosphatase [Rhodoferax koreense]